MIYLNALLGLSFVLGMIMLLGLVMKKAGLQFDNYQKLKQQNGNLKMIETLRIDTKRRLLLFACNNKNFLVLTGDKDILLSDDLELLPPELAQIQNLKEKA